MAAKTCGGCQGIFHPINPLQTSCSPACRQRQYRQRTDGVAVSAFGSPPLDTPPDMPVGLGDAGRQVWESVWTHGRYTVDDIPSIVRLCELNDVWHEAGAAIARDGLILPDGKVHPAHATRMKVAEALNSLEDRLGRNPRASLLQAMKLKSLADASPEEVESKQDAFLKEHEA